MKPCLRFKTYVCEKVYVARLLHLLRMEKIKEIILVCPFSDFPGKTLTVWWVRNADIIDYINKNQILGIFNFIFRTNMSLKEKLKILCFQTYIVSSEHKIVQNKLGRSSTVQTVAQFEKTELFWLLFWWSIHEKHFKLIHWRNYVLFQDKYDY